MKIVKQNTFDFAEDEKLSDHIIRNGEDGYAEALSCFKAARAFALDIETFGKDQDGLDPFKGQIRLIQIGLMDGTVIIYDLGGWGKQRPIDREFLDLLKEKCEDDSLIIGQNLKFDGGFLWRKFGIRLREIRDTMLFSSLYYAGLKDGGKKIRHSLGEIAKRFELKVDKTLQKSDFGWDLSNAQLNYAAKDVTITLEIAKRFKTMLQDEKMWEIAVDLCHASEAFMMMEYYGMPVNLEKLEEILKGYQSAADEVIKEFTKVFPEINPASSKQVVIAINRKYGTELEHSNDEELVNFEDPWAKALLDWRSLNQVIKYLIGVKERTVEGCARSNFKIIGPNGTRSTSSDPNLQNPANLNSTFRELGLRAVREIFEAPKGKKMIVCDLSSSHGRIATECSKDPVLIEGYKNGLDLHSITASSLAAMQHLGPEWTPENIAKWKKGGHENSVKAKTIRAVSKTVFFSQLNAAGPGTLQVGLQTADDPIEVTIDEAKQAIEAWKNTYSVLADYQLKITQQANSTDVEYGGLHYGVTRSICGQRIHLEKYPTKYGGVAVKPSDCSAFQWMSTEGCLMRRVMYRMMKEIDSHPEWGAWIANFCHDELDYIVDEEYAVEFAKLAQYHMDLAMSEYVKIIPPNEPDNKPESSICNSWAEK